MRCSAATTPTVPCVGPIRTRSSLPLEPTVPVRSTLAPVDAVQLSPDDWSKALADTEGPQLIIAGPGTGKTEFLARRCATLIGGGSQPASLAVLTFSRRAAGRLTDRIAGLVDGSAPRAVTFHSLAYRLLETFAPTHLGWDDMPTLLTGPEQVALVRRLLGNESPGQWSPTFREILTTQTMAREVADFIMRSQEYLIDDDVLSERCLAIPDWRGLAAFRRRYLDELKRTGRIDYGTLQAQAVRVLSTAAVQKEVAEQFSHVIVDEFQDTTAAQAHLIRELAASTGNVTVAGDPAQSIYRFRGAEVGNITDFPGDFQSLGPVRVMELTQSFRCPAEILEAGRRLLPTAHAATTSRLSPAPHRGSVEAYTFSQASEEAEWIAAEIQKMTITDEIPLSRVAVLVRTKRGLLTELSRALSRRNISHNTPDSRLVDHPAVRIVFDLALAAAFNNERNEMGIVGEVDRAMRRVLLGPLFSLTLGAERRALRTRHLTGSPWSAVVATEIDGGAALSDLLDNPAWATEQPAASGFWKLWSSLPQFQPLVDDAQRGDFRIALTSFSQSLGRLFERDPARTLLAYRLLADSDDFEAEPLITLADRQSEQVTLTTLHQAKGLDFDAVFVADAVEDVFPDLRRNRSLLQPRRLAGAWVDDPATEALEQMREEVRLAYTATTRASRRVVWTATTAGFDHGNERPSRFLPIIAGTSDIASPVEDEHRMPLTYLEAEAHLRRIVVDPAHPSPRRLAALDQLVRRPNVGLRPASSFTMVRPRGPDNGVVDLPLRLSPSQAEKYASCPRRYVLERRLAVDADYGSYGTFGTLIHQVLEVSEGAAIAAGRVRSSRDDAFEALEVLFERYDLGVGELREAWRRRATELLNALYDDWIRPNGVPRLLEHPLSLVIEGVEWIGRADRIESEGDRVRIVDYKTSTTAAKIDDAATSLQLGFYLLAAQQDPEVLEHGTPTEAEMWFPLARGKPTIRSLDPSRLGEVEERLAAIAAGIAAENWDPNVSPECERCSVRLVCPAFPEGREAFVR